MKKYLLLMLLFVPFLFLMISGCDDAENIFKTVEKEKFAPPLGLTSVTQDGQVTLFWYTSNYEKDFGGYYVFMAQGDYTSLSNDSTINETVFAKVDSISFTTSSDAVVSRTITGLTNGTTYSFTIVSFNKKDTEKVSYPSNIIKDTPRPDVTSIVVQSAGTSDVTGNDNQAGFDIHNFQVVEVPATLGDYTTTDGIADLINEAFDPNTNNLNIRPWIAGMNGAGLQDLGYMENLDKADVAPAQGYSDTGESIAALLGHVYAIKTGDNHYGKLIITNIGDVANNFAITFNVALQLQANDRNYKAADLNYKLGIK